MPPATEWPDVGAGFADDGVHLRDYLRVVLKHRRLIAGTLIAAVATTALVNFTMEPRFTGSATVQIERQAPKFAPVQGIEQSETAVVDKYDYYQTQYEILGSRTIAARVIRELGLENDDRFREDASGGLISDLYVRVTSSIFGSGEDAAPGALGVPSDLIDRYLDSLSIDPVRNSRLVNVHYTSESSDLAAEVANRHIDEYVAASLDQRLDMTLRAKEFLEAELGKAKQRVNVAEAALNKFRKEQRIVSLDGGRSDIVSERLGDLNEEFTSAQAERIRLESQYQLIKSREYESLPEVLASPLVGQLKQEVSKIEIERADLAKRYKPAFPKMKEAIAREAQAKQRLSDEVRKIVSGVESSYLAAKKREEELGRQLEAQREKALHQKDVGADYDTLARDVETARGLYANLLQRLKDVDVAEEIKVSNVVVVDRASVPNEASAPRKALNLSLAALLGLLAGAGLAFLIEYFDNTVKTPADVEQRLGLPSLGVIPSFDNPAIAYGGAGASATVNGKATTLPAKRTNGHSPGGELMVATQPLSIVAESYRSVRTAILMSQSDSPPQVLLFTSGSAGEGKTVTTVNQAITLAQSGARVLLIDADIRKPRVHRIFDLENAVGLSTFLTGNSELADVVHVVPFGGANGKPRNGATDSPRHALGGSLSVLPAGPMPPNPTELLGSRKMRATLGELREQYDYIVIDTPPVLPVTDAVLLARACDGVVLVVRGQETPLDVVAKSRDRLMQVHARILGVVLNDVDVTSGDYEEYHRYYYSYYSSPEAAREA